MFIGFVLVLLLAFRPPSDQLTVAVGPGQAEQCPTGGATACFRFDVTNTGSADGVVTCVTTAAIGTEAEFANGAQSIGVRLEAGEVKGVYARVIPAEGDEIVSPTLTCTP